MSLLKNRKWDNDEEEQLIESLKNNKSLEFCSETHQRSINAIKLRLELIIYKMD